jgi:hypothetical protein
LEYSCTSFFCAAVVKFANFNFISKQLFLPFVVVLVLFSGLYIFHVVVCKHSVCLRCMWIPLICLQCSEQNFQYFAFFSSLMYKNDTWRGEKWEGR